jgi:RHS repeat-associated protein
VRGRLLSKTDPTSGWSLEYTWHTAGRTSSIGIRPTGGSSAFKTDYTYDAAGRMHTVTDVDARTYTLSHDPAGNLAQLERPNGVNTTWTHDTRNRLTEIRTFRVSDNATIASYAYTLSPSGQRTSIVESDGTQRGYGYDSVSRLTTEAVTGGSGPTYTKTFGYDAVSNRTSQVTTGFQAGNVSYAYDSRQRLTTENAADYAWDANGNQLSNPAGDTFEWDYDDRLIRVVKADGTVVQNVYDADGVLVRTTVTPTAGAAVTTNYLVDTTGALSHVVAEIRGGNLQKTYVRAGNMLLAELEGMPGGGVRYYEAEGIGSVRSLLDNGGSKTDTWRYTAFGETIARSGMHSQPYGFAGEVSQLASGLSYNRARWMHPGIGRFLRTDPFDGLATDPRSLNPYVYAGSDPVNAVDPTGLISWSAVDAATVGVLALFGGIYAINKYLRAQYGNEALVERLKDTIPEVRIAHGDDMKKPFDDGVEDLIHHWWTKYRHTSLAFKEAKDLRRDNGFAIEQDPVIATAEHYLWGLDTYLQPEFALEPILLPPIAFAGEMAKFQSPDLTPPTSRMPPSPYSPRGWAWTRQGFAGMGTKRVPLICWNQTRTRLNALSSFGICQ